MAVQVKSPAPPFELEGNLIGSAPLLLEACKRAKEFLDNNHVVTEEGLRINTGDVRDKLLDAIEPKATGLTVRRNEPTRGS